MDSLEVFDPVDYSLEENKYLLGALGKPPIVALREIPAGVNPRAVEPLINRVYSLIELEKHEGVSWCGVEPVKEAIQAYLTKAERWAEDAKRTKRAPRFPSMASYDSRKRAHRSGPGSDAGKVRTYFNERGERVPFALELVPSGDIEWSPGMTTADDPDKTSGLSIDKEKNRIECFCGHTESFNAESRGSFNAARARMSKHLRTSKTEVERHKEVHTNEYN